MELWAFWLGALAREGLLKPLAWCVVLVPCALIGFVLGALLFSDAAAAIVTGLLMPLSVYYYIKFEEKRVKEELRQKKLAKEKEREAIKMSKAKKRKKTLLGLRKRLKLTKG